MISYQQYSVVIVDWKISKNKQYAFQFRIENVLFFVADENMYSKSRYRTDFY